jgi:hypothetical protein
MSNPNAATIAQDLLGEHTAVVDLCLSLMAGQRLLSDEESRLAAYVMSSGVRLARYVAGADGETA